MHRCNPPNQNGSFRNRNTTFCFFSGNVHLYQYWNHLARSMSAPVKLFCKLEPINSLDHVEDLNGILCLVGLEMAYEVPGYVLFHPADLALGLLDIIVAQDVHSGSNCLRKLRV